MSRAAAICDWAVLLLTAITLGGLVYFASGCASNGVRVHEQTFNEDGTPASELTVTQRTISTWGAQQQEGAGQFHYEADGERFEMDAGAGVEGQQAGDPVRELLNAAELIRSVKGPE